MELLSCSAGGMGGQRHRKECQRFSADVGEGIHDERVRLLVLADLPIRELASAGEPVGAASGGTAALH